MERTIFSIICFACSALAIVGAQCPYSLEGIDYGLGKLVDPLLIRTHKSMCPKKQHNGKMGYEKDLVTQAKYKLASRLLARHLKNLNSANSNNNNAQNYLYQNPQAVDMRNVLLSSGKASLFGQQQSGTGQIQIPCNAMGSVTSGGYPRIQQAVLQQSAQQLQCNGLNCLRPQQIIIPNQVALRLQN